jgi:cytochrome P450
MSTAPDDAAPGGTATRDADEGPSTNDMTAAVTEVMSDLSAPQERYVEMMGTGYVEAFEGMALSFNREDTQFLTRQNDAFSTRTEVNLGNVRPLIPLNIDPPKHVRFRRLLDPLFAAKRMAARDADIAARVNGFIDTFIERGECNFTEEFADPFPSSVFLGLTDLPEEELPMFLELRDGILHPEKFDPAAPWDLELRAKIANATGARLYEYFGELIARRQEEPADDLISHLLASEIDGDRLTPEEIMDIFYLFMVAGLDTVGDALTCLFAHLAQHPERRQLIVDDPQLIPAAVEELLRWESPVPATLPRLATRTIELPSGATVPEGTAVLPHWGAANLDPETFGDPMEVRFDRTNNPHLAFGSGIHRCLGAHLARVELRVAVREWHARIPQYRIKPGHEELEYPPGLRHVKNLMLVWP